MIESVALAVMALGFCFLMGFFFSGVETAVITARRYKLQNRADGGDAAAELTLRLMDNPQRVITATLIGTQLANVLMALFFKLILDMTWSESNKPAFGVVHWSEVLGIVALTPVVVVFAEIFPKALFRAKADEWIVGLRPILSLFMSLCAPVIWGLDLLVRVTLRLTGAGADRPRMTRADVILMLNPPISRGGGNGRAAEDAREAAREAAEPAAERAAQAAQAAKADPSAATPPPGAGAGAGSLGATGWNRRDPDERELIRNIIELDRTHVGEIMRPLVELAAIQLSQMTLEKAVEIARSSGYSRFPVYRNRIINLIGYVDIYDIIRSSEPGRTLEDFVRPAHFVPETKRVDDLLQEFLDKRLKNAIVVNEYGGCVGWVTLEDILEEIVGELEDELDLPETMVRDQGDGTFQIEGRVHIEELNEALGMALVDADCDTLGGLIMKESGRIPKAGDEIQLQGWLMRVQEMDGLRVKLVHASAAVNPEADGEEE